MGFFTDLFQQHSTATPEVFKNRIPAGDLIPEAFYFNVDQHDIISLAYDNSSMLMEIRYYNRQNLKEVIVTDCTFETYLDHLLRLQNKNRSSNDVTM